MSGKKRNQKVNKQLPINCLQFFSYSVPDALSGIAVVKEGHGDMAVSNAIGSNVFDILVCLGNACCLFTKQNYINLMFKFTTISLGLPWFLDTAIVNPDEYVKVQSKGRYFLNQ